MSGPIEPTASGVRLRVRIQPRASRSELTGVRGDALWVRIAAPPVDGKANDALIRFLAERLGVGREEIRIRSGKTGRHKLLEVDGLAAPEVGRRLGLDPGAGGLP